MNSSIKIQLLNCLSNATSNANGSINDGNINDNNITEPLSQINQEIRSIKKKRKKPIFCQHNKWTSNEDIILMKLVNDLGDNNWINISKIMQRRNPRQCKERWSYYLNPDLKIGQWTKEEDELLLRKKEEIGPKWTRIAKFFKNRTDAMIKTRYNALIRAQNQKMGKMDVSKVTAVTNVEKSADFNSKNAKNPEKLDVSNFFNVHKNTDDSDDYFSKNEEILFENDSFLIDNYEF